MTRQDLAIAIGRAALAAEQEHYDEMTYLAGGSMRRVVERRPEMRVDALVKMYDSAKEPHQCK